MSLEILEFFVLDGFGQNLAQKLNSMGLIPNLKQYFTLEANIKSILATFFNFPSYKKVPVTP